MANTPHRGEPHSKPSTQQQDQTQKKGRATDRSGKDQDEPDRNDVEIGDPVPEDDRTVRVRGRAGGETGEDEDLPDDTGDIEGGSERH